MTAARMKLMDALKRSETNNKENLSSMNPDNNNNNRNQAPVERSHHGMMRRHIPRHYAGDIEYVQDVDVMCEKGKVALAHPGNKTLTSLVNDYCHKYRTSTLRVQKTRTTAAVIEQVRLQGARFIKYDPLTGVWYEADDVCAHEKVSHALRTAARKLSKRKTKGPRGTKKRQPETTTEKQYFMELFQEQQDLLQDLLLSDEEAED